MFVGAIAIRCQFCITAISIRMNDDFFERLQDDNTILDAAFPLDTPFD